MRTGAVVSGGIHAALIALAILGDMLFPAQPASLFEVSQVELISAAQFDAAISAAPTAPEGGFTAPTPTTPPAETRAPGAAAAPETPPPPSSPPPAPDAAPPAPAAPMGDAPDKAVQMAKAPAPPPLAAQAPAAPHAPAQPARADARPRADTPPPPEPAAAPLAPVANAAPSAPDGDLPPAPAAPEPPQAAPAPEQPAPPPAPRPAARPARIAEAPPPPETSPQTTPKTPPKTPRQTDAERRAAERAALDAAIAAVSAETRPAEPAAQAPKAQGGARRADRPIAGSVLAGLVSGVRDRFNPVQGGAESLSARVKFEIRLSSEGRLIGKPELIEPAGTLDPQHAALRRAALIALTRADDAGVFRALPAESYDRWRVIRVTFTPEEILFL